MKTKLFTKAISFAITTLMVLAMMPINAFAIVSDFVSETHTTFSSSTTTIAPGVTQSINYAYANDGKQMVYYVATADITRNDVIVQTSYKDQYVNKAFGMQKLTEHMAYADALYTDKTSDRYISEYYKAVAGVNASFYNMTTGQPSGVTYLDGVQIGESSSYNQFFAILNDGTAVVDYTKNLANYEGNIWQACAGSQMLVWDGKDVTASSSGSYNTDRHSRTCVGITAEGKVVMMSLDGRQEPFSCGGTMHELAQIMLEQGCVAAINLDGGGSTTFAARQAGEDNVSIINRPSDGSERSISSGLIIASLAAPSNVFATAVLNAETEYVTPGSTVIVTAKGVSPAGTSAEIPEDVSWNISDSSIGTIEDGLFVSSGVVGDAEIQMLYEGEVVGTTIIHVVLPDAIIFDNSIITVPYGKTVTFGVTATYGLNKVALKEDDVTLELSNDAIGVLDGFSFTACKENENISDGTVTIVLKADKSITASATINLGKGSEIMMDFENNDLGGIYIKTGYPQYGPMGSNKDANGNYYYNGQNELGKVYIVDSNNGKVHNGDYALAVECDYTQPYETGYHMLTMQGFSIKAPANATTIGMWIYIPELEELMTTSVRICGYLGSKDENKGTVTSPWLWDNCTPYGWENSGWRYLTMDISGYNDTIEFAYMQFYICDRDNTDVDFKFSDHASVNSKHTYYIDNITVDYSSAVDDRDAPVFSSVVFADEFTNDAPELNGQTTTSNVLSFTATVADYVANNATGIDVSTVNAYIDGVLVDSTYTGGKIVITDAVLADGVHTIRFEASDNMRNLSYVEKQINVKSGSGLPTVSIVPENLDADKILIGSLYWIDVVATSAMDVQDVVVTLNLNSVSQWELEHMVVTNGFMAKYIVDDVTNNATITIIRNDEVDENETILARIPIRTWESRLTEFAGYEAQTPEKLWSRKIIWPMDIKLSTNYGSVTFMDGTKGSFSMPNIAVVTELYGNYAELNANGDYSNKSSWHIHTATAIEDKAATCTEVGYTGRTYCAVCDSVVDWGTSVSATGHTYKLVEGVLMCECGRLFNGTHTDGKNYVDGIVSGGWIGNSYFVDGVPLTGIQLVDGYYYNFGEDGVNQGKHTGIFFDGEVYRYSQLGELSSGWKQIDNEWYYFKSSTLAAQTGSRTMGVVTYEFEDNGKLKSGVWYSDGNGTRYYYGYYYYYAVASWKNIVWANIEGKTYGFNEDGYRYEGLCAVHESNAPLTVYRFASNGELIESLPNYTGFVETFGNLAYLDNGVQSRGLTKIG